MKFCSSLFIFFLIANVLIFPQEASSQNGLKAEYYDGRNFEKLVAVRLEDKIDHHWNRIPPVPGINPHVCSIRWTGKIKTSESGFYKFAARVDDGIRVWVDDKMIINNWKLNDVGISNGKVKLEAGQYYDLKVEYFNALIEGEVRLLWAFPDNDRKWYHIWSDTKFVKIDPQYFFQPDGGVVSWDVEPVVAKADQLKSPNREVPAQKRKVKPKVARPVEVNESIPAVQEDIVDIPLTEEQIEEYKPKNIQFERAKTTILEESFVELNRFADFMLEHPELTVKIEGHTDPVGDESKNFNLSERRAYAVARYLVKKGIVAKRISAEGFGGTRPIAIPEDGTYFPGNRRVEFIVSESEILAGQN